MAVSATNGGSKTVTYKISGKTLADLVKEMDKKGPPDPNDGGKRFSGRCLGQLDIQLGAKDLDVVLDEAAKPVKATAKLKSGSVKVTCTITMPALASDKDLSAAAKAEWKRFLGAVKKHEDGHVAMYLHEARHVAGKLDLTSAEATGATAKAAQAAASKALLAKLSADWGGTVLKDLMNATAKAYDAQNKHGATQGAVLDGTIA